jgi:hypothetical protein
VVYVKSGKKAFILAVAGAAALLFLGGLYVAEKPWGVGAQDVNRLLSAAASWLAFTSLLSCAAAAPKGTKSPWFTITAGIFLLALAETAILYFTVVRDEMPPGLWVINFALLGAYVIIIAGLIIKARSLPLFAYPWSKSILMAAVAVTFIFVFYEAVRVALASPEMPSIIKALVLAFPVVDLAMLMLAVHITVTYGRGVAGRPWAAVAVGVAFLALSDVLAGLARVFLDSVALYSALASVAQFAGYSAIAWGAWYQRVLSSEV